MSWNFAVPYEDPADDRPLLDRFADAAQKSGMPQSAWTHHVALIRHILADHEPDDRGLETHFLASGHLNADGTGSYNISVSYAPPPLKLRDTTATTIPAFATADAPPPRTKPTLVADKPLPAPPPTDIATLTVADEYGVPVSAEIAAAMLAHQPFPHSDPGDEDVPEKPHDPVADEVADVIAEVLVPRTPLNYRNEADPHPEGDL